MSNTELIEDIKHYEKLTKHRCNIDSTQIERMISIYDKELAVTTKLDLSHNSIDNKAVRKLCTILMLPNNNIEELILTDNHHMDMISLIYILHALKHENCVLKSLDLSNNDLKYVPLTETSFEKIDDLEYNTDTDSDNFKNLFNLKNLQKLNLKNTNIDDNFVGLILSNENKSLIELDLSENNLYTLDTTLKNGDAVSNVKKLNLSFNNLKDFDCKFFQNVETLNLSNNCLRSAGLQNIFINEHMKHLTSLDVSNSFTDTEPTADGWLNFFGGDLDFGENVVKIKLKSLNLEYTALTTANFNSIITTQPQLTDLNISRNVIDKAVLQNFFNSDNKIEKLSVTFPQDFVNQNNLTALDNILKKLTSFSVIDTFNNNNLALEILTHIHTTLKKSSKFISLTLKKVIKVHDNLDTDYNEYTKTLKEIIQFDKLTYLDLSENEILEKPTLSHMQTKWFGRTTTPSPVNILTEVVDNLKKPECRLQTLKLHGSEIRTKNKNDGKKDNDINSDTVVLSNVVTAGNKPLSERLDDINNNKYKVGDVVGGNVPDPKEVTKTNIEPLLEGLINKNCKLLTLDLRGYNFSDEAKIALINTIQLNTTLTKLDIGLDDKYLRKTIDVNKKLAEYIRNSNYPALGTNLYRWDKENLEKFYASLITPNNRKHDTLLQQVRNKIDNTIKNKGWGLGKTIGTYIGNLKHIQQELKKVKAESSYSILQNNKKFNITVSQDGTATTIAQFKDLSQQDKNYVIQKLEGKKTKKSTLPQTQ